MTGSTGVRPLLPHAQSWTIDHPTPGEGDEEGEWRGRRATRRRSENTRQGGCLLAEAAKAAVEDALPVFPCVCVCVCVCDSGLCVPRVGKREPSGEGGLGAEEVCVEVDEKDKSLNGPVARNRLCTLDLLHSAAVFGRGEAVASTPCVQEGCTMPPDILPPFTPAATFRGAVPGSVFTTGPFGTG